MTIAAICFTSAFAGKLTGFLIASFTKNLGRRFEGCLTGFTAGLLIAFVCFEILAEGFMAASLPVCVAGILAGVFVAAYLDGLVARMAKTDGRGAKTSMLIAAGVAIHNLPEGIALGSMCAVSLTAGLSLAAIIGVHCIPEAAAIFLPIRRGDKNTFAMLLIAAALSLPMMIGGVIGVIITNVSGVFLALSLTFAGGVMLYITCGEILPEAKTLWNGRLTTVCALMGFILGVVITA